MIISLSKRPPSQMWERLFSIIPTVASPTITPKIFTYKYKPYYCTIYAPALSHTAIDII